MLSIIRNLLVLLINNIDSGNSNISENLLLEVIDFIRKISSNRLNKTEACDYLGISKSSFNNYIDKGLIPKGIKEPGKLKFWLKSDLDDYLNKNLL